MGIFRTYRDQYGWVAVPGRPFEKRPPGKWKNYQTERPSDAEVDQWDREADDQAAGLPQVGIVTGSLSGIIVLDVDEPAGHQWVEKQGGPGITVAAISSPGDGDNIGTMKVHYYYRHPGGNCPNKKKDQWPAVGCDLRGDGGYIMAPPSRHPDTDHQKYDDYN